MDFLEHIGADTLIGLPGDDIELLGALQTTAIKFIAVRDQRSALFMTTGYAMESGRPGVSVLGKGPAVTNALTGLVEASFSSAPVLVIAGATGSDERGARAFQEFDQMSVVRPIVKWATRVEHPKAVVRALEQAWTAVTHGRRGPAYLEFPDHLIGQPVIRTRAWSLTTEMPEKYGLSDSPGTALDAVRSSSRPIILVGGGMRHRNDGRLLEQLADLLGAAMFVTASGRGVVSEEHRSFCGLSGLYSPHGMDGLWQSCDLVITLGTRLEETATIGWEDLGLDGKVLQVNIDPLELSAQWTGIRVVADAALVVCFWLSMLGERHLDEAWLASIAETRGELHRRAATELDRAASSDRLHVREILATLTAALPEDHVLVQENGLQDMWSYFYPIYSTALHGGSIVPSEQTTLGFGAVAAAGVKLASPHRTIVAWVGDGAFDSVLPDLLDIDRAGIGVLFVVLRNGGLGWLQRQLEQRVGPGSRFSFVHPVSGTRHTPSGPDRGLHERTVFRKEDLLAAIKEALAVSEGGRVAVLNVPVALTDVAPEIIVRTG